MSRQLLCAALCTVAAATAAAPDAAERKRPVPERPPAHTASAGSASAGASAVPSALFRRADRNQDGYLSEQELWSAPVESGDGWIAADRDRDGRIAPSEFASVRSAAVPRR